MIRLKKPRAPALLLSAENFPVQCSVGNLGQGFFTSSLIVAAAAKPKIKADTAEPAKAKLRQKATHVSTKLACANDQITQFLSRVARLPPILEPAYSAGRS